jgi:serine/threonine protein kinase/Flp pilus assembly protein TadD
MSRTDASAAGASGEVSVAPSMLDALSNEQQIRLTAILDKYLRDLENGLPPQQERLVASHPDLREVLTAYLENLTRLHEVTAAFGQPGESSGASPSTDADRERDGHARRLGDYELLREVGRGGMGVVYEARQLSLERRVALKVLPFAAVLERQQISRFKNEAQAAAQLHHPNIVPVFAVGAERGVHYYAMQFVDGQPLDRAIASLRVKLRREPRERGDAVGGTGSCSQNTIAFATTATARAAETASLFRGKWSARGEYFRTVVRLGMQAADALHAAHCESIVHRDIKPSNLLLDDAGKLWITDFGLARCQDDRTLTRSGDVIGTRQYMSPEQALGKPALVDHRTDIYSLGATLYELLTLEPARAARHRGDEAEPVRPRKLDPQIPADLETVVLKAMATDRDDRYLTAEELAADLRRVLEGRTTIARPPTLLDRTGRFARRHQRVVALAAAACLLAMLGLTASALLVNRARTSAQRNFERAERHFREARGAVDQLGSRTAERLSGVPGAERVRQQLLQDTLDYYQRFVDEAQHDPALRADLALTYSKIGTLYDEMRARDAAIEAHRQALKLAQQLDTVGIDTGEAQRRVAVCHNNLGLALHRAGRADDAEREFDRAIEMQQSLCAAQPGEGQFRVDLALSHNNLGLLQSETGRTDAASASFRAAIRLQEEAAGATGNVDPDVWRDLAASLNNLAALVRDEQPQQTLELQRQAADHLARAASARPGETRYKSDWALALNNLGAALARAGAASEAIASYRKAIELQKQLVRLAPLERGFRRDLAVTFNNLGLAYTQVGQPDNAQRSFRNALGFQEPLASENPQDLEILSSLGGMYNNLGITLEELGRIDSAAENYRRAVEWQQAAQSQAPASNAYREFLSKHFYNLGRALRTLGKAGEAADVALARKELWRHDPQRLLSIAEELALASQMLSGDDESERSAAGCAELSVATLREAVAAGLQLPSDLDRQSSFAALRGRNDFQSLVHP